jgi:hypothetical protein
MEDRKIYPLPEKGEITYAPNGNCICPFCGKAFRKLGRHFNYAHGMTSDEAHKEAGWDRNAKATNEDYRKLMRDKLQEKCVTVNLIKKGKKTRFKKGSQGRTKDKMSLMSLKKIQRRNKK